MLNQGLTSFKSPVQNKGKFLSFYVKSVLINPAIFKFLLCARRQMCISIETLAAPITNNRT